MGRSETLNDNEGKYGLSYNRKLLPTVLIMPEENSKELQTSLCFQPG